MSIRFHLQWVFMLGWNLYLHEEFNSLININNGEFNISYNLSSCNLLNSSVVSNDLKCLMLCQMTVCKNLIYDFETNTCILNGSQPGLIEYANLTDLNIVYNLGKLTLFSLIFNFSTFLCIYLNQRYVFKLWAVLSIRFYLQWFFMLEWNLYLHEKFNSVNKFQDCSIY